MSTPKTPLLKQQPDLSSIRNALRFNTEQLHNADSSSIDIILTLRLTNIVLQDLIDRYGRVFGLSAARSNALLALYSVENHTMQAHMLADVLYSTRANVTWLVNSLVDSGLVVTKTAPDDRRSKTIKLTPKGLKLIQSFAPAHYSALDETTANLTPSERTTLLELLDKIRNRTLKVGKSVIADVERKRKTSSLASANR